MKTSYDVVIVGAGLAGLTLARQLLLYSEKSVLLLDREAELPIQRQKVGESNVQVAGHYFAKVLDLETHLYHEHVMKYNLRFMWKAAGLDGSRFEHFGHSYIRKFSNIACYQLDRNKLEKELLRLNGLNERYQLALGVRDIDIKLGEREADHHVRFRQSECGLVDVACRWLVDTSGRVRHLTGKLQSRRESEIQHSASFFWVDGTVNIEKLTDSSLQEIRQRSDRAHLGHLPFWLATNHFMGEGFWFWVIPLHSRTSFGLVYDNKLVDSREVSTKEKLLAWLFERFPLFQRELEDSEIIDFQVMRNYSHDCERTIHRDRWALSGFAGRFTDPLYSPGGDSIAIYNTLIVDAILTDGLDDLAGKVPTYEALMKTVYLSFVPSFHLSYNVLGDQETFNMKYVWELSIYFSFYVFPFINDLFTDKRFLVSYLRRFAQLGAINRSLLLYISAYYEWKKDHVMPSAQPHFFDFTRIETLNRAEATFYKVGMTAQEAVKELDAQLESLHELARYYIAHVSSVVSRNSGLLRDQTFVQSIQLDNILFDAAAIEQRCRTIEGNEDASYAWNLDPEALQEFVEMPTSLSS